MAKRMKSTPFARFLLVMVILAPLAYIGASYYNGEDGIQNFKNLIGLGEKKEMTISADKPADRSDVTELQKEVDYLKRRVQELEDRNRDLLKEIGQKDAEIKTLKGN